MTSLCVQGGGKLNFNRKKTGEAKVFFPAGVTLLAHAKFTE